MKPFPISHNDYLDWIILLASTSTKKEQEFLAFYQTVLTLANGDWIPENLEFKINGKVLTAHNVFAFDLVSATRDIKAGKYKKDSIDEVYIYHHTTVKSSILPPQENQPKPEDFLTFVQNYVANFTGDESVYYHKLPITEDVLFLLCNDEDGSCYKRIREELLPYLRYLDLSGVPFQNADIRGQDLSYTNISSLSLSEVYKRSANNTDLTGVVLAPEIIRSCDLSQSILNETYARVEVTSNKIKGMTYDSTVLLIDGQDRILPNTSPQKDVRIVLHL